jgi:hypothetical protein
MTAGFIARYLREIAKKPWFENFRQTLPRPGMEGTVRRIGYTDPRFRVKTGRLDDVFALAGYGIDAGGRSFAFAFMVNTGKRGTHDRFHSRGELLRLLAEGAAQSGFADRIAQEKPLLSTGMPENTAPGSAKSFDSTFFLEDLLVNRQNTPAL